MYKFGTARSARGDGDEKLRYASCASGVLDIHMSLYICTRIFWFIKCGRVNGMIAVERRQTKFLYTMLFCINVALGIFLGL